MKTGCAGVQAGLVMVGGRQVSVYTGGEGEAVVLLHGGWGSARMHWSAVWASLAERFHVVAPELPGYGINPGPLDSVHAYVRWLEALLDALGIREAFCIGNSFGASLAWSFAASDPERCRGLVIVNGLFMPETPALLLRLGRVPLLRRIMRSRLRKTAYTARAIERGFFQHEQIPSELQALVSERTSPQLETMTDVLIGGGTPGVPGRPPLLVFGEQDRLPGTTPAEARALQARIPGSRLVFIPNAGHLPQLENPQAFLAAVVPFLESS